ncbi:competence protein ComEA [Kitasatospora sp. GAS204A]|uniref:helix-hairpin-helix domain-containing protein n=1 Tax=unclassified Kitasatospora TaxID=2633591 RepID=UPI00247636CD|nr:helix-hairpin-helix domain-containing protein [Kitasatospora sp. GAS204B]MDH6118731.1 competence protein ComEA [Kitasatospora sp. GAS204B]
MRPPTSPAAAREPAPPQTDSAGLPDGWPQGYGRRATPGSSAAEPPGGAAPTPAPATPEPAPPASPLAPSPVLTRSGGRRFRLPAALHSLLLADRKAVLGLTVLLLLAVGYAVQHFWFGRPQPVAVPVGSTRPVSKSAAQAELSTAPALNAGSAAAPTAAPDAAPLPASPGAPTAGSDSPASSPVVIDVAGRVAHPGIRTLPSGSRVADALRAAGGALPGVDTDTLNMARILLDGEQVLVGAPSPPAQGGLSPTGPKAPVSLNHATLDQLDALPGVGPVLAKHILDFRSAHGLFRSLDQLRQISGIGDRKLAELKPLVTL